MSRRERTTLPLYQASRALNVGRPRLEAQIRRTGCVVADVPALEIDGTYRVPVVPLAAALGLTPAELLARVDNGGHDDAPAG